MVRTAFAVVDRFEHSRGELLIIMDKGIQALHKWVLRLAQARPVNKSRSRG